ncbi:MAG: hypothetical protein CL802_08895 [Citromicrobium sp.]|nr:hypothetical protein [Citromicrobium sp.]
MRFVQGTVSLKQLFVSGGRGEQAWSEAGSRVFVSRSAVTSFLTATNQRLVVALKLRKYHRGKSSGKAGDTSAAKFGYHIACRSTPDAQSRSLMPTGDATFTRGFGPSSVFPTGGLRVKLISRSIQSSTLTTWTYCR